MPGANDLVEQLRTIANEWRDVATAWHVFLAALLTSLYLGWRPSVRLLVQMLVLPLLGVSAVAGLTGNLFNSGMFAMLALTLGALASRQADVPVRMASVRTLSIGTALVIYGAAYPHFVDVDMWIEYAYAAPLGIVPCPTLAVLIGLSLMLRGADSPPWACVLSAAGVFYATVGIMWFGIALDVVLLAGALALTAEIVATDRSMEQALVNRSR